MKTNGSFLQISQQVPIPNEGDTDTQYSIKLLAFMGTLLLVGLGFAIREYLRYRNTQDEKREKRDAELDTKRDKQYADAEALRVEARQRLDALIVSRFDQSDQNQADFEAGIRAEIDAIKRANEARDRDVFRLNEQFSQFTKPK